MPITDRPRRLTRCQTWLAISLIGLIMIGSTRLPGAFAATFYVDNACAINGSGTSVTCGPNGPWNRLNKAKHCAGMRPGDIMEIRAGKGVYNEGAWEPQASCQGVTVQNYPGEDAVLDGTADISGSAWTHMGSGVYQCTAGRCGTPNKFPFTAWYDFGDGVERRLNLIQSKRTYDTTLAPGNMRYTTTKQICARTMDGSSPAKAAYFRIPMVHAGIQLTLTQVDYLTLRSHPSGKGRFRIQRFRDHGINSQTTSRAITYDGLDISWVMDRCINQSEGGLAAANYQIVNNHIHHCGQEGIRWSQDVSPTGLVAHNEVYDIQSEPVFEHCFPNCLSGFVDNGTGIRVLSHNGTVRHNRIHDIGGGKTGRSYGINLENGTPGIRVESNYIYNMNHGLTGPRNGQAILLSSTGSQRYAGVVIQNNRIHNVDVCFAFDIGDEMPAGDTVHLANNTCNDPSEYGLDMQDGDYKTAIHIVNNIFRAVNTTPTLLINVPWRHSRGFHPPSLTATIAQPVPGASVTLSTGKAGPMSAVAIAAPAAIAFKTSTPPTITAIQTSMSAAPCPPSTFARRRARLINLAAVRARQPTTEASRANPRRTSAPTNGAQQKQKKAAKLNEATSCRAVCSIRKKKSECHATATIHWPPADSPIHPG